MDNLDFVNALNDSSVTYVPATCREYDDFRWEAISPFGEIRGFTTKQNAEAWRIREVKKTIR